MERTFTASYNGISIADAPRECDGVHHFEDSWERGSIRFTYIVSAGSESALATAVAADLSAWRTPHQRFRFQLGGTDEVDYDPANGTALLVYCTARKAADNPWNSGKACAIEVSVQCEKAGDKNSRVGRRSATIAVSYTPSRRRSVKLAGVWTRITTTAARDQYEAQFATWALAVLDAIDSDATWHLGPEDAGPVDDEGHVLRFEATYVEILGDVTVTPPSGVTLVDPTLSVDVQTDSPGDAVSDVARLTTVVCRYTCKITSTCTRAQAVQLVASINSLMRTAATDSVPGNAGMARVLHQPRFDETDRVLGVDSVYMVATNSRISSERTEQVNYSQKILVPRWSGNPYDHAEYDGPERMTCTVRIVETLVGSADRAIEGRAKNPNPPLSLPPNGCRWVPTKSTPGFSETVIGAGTDDTLQTVRVTHETTWEARSES